tara:strand:- start:295 stop:756 length:462 start_codon:yes stop_codon:yes gene_type:complete
LVGAEKDKGSLKKSSDQRYLDTGQVILDSKTQLMWFKLDFWQLEGKHLNWYQAQEYLQKVNNKKYYDHSDWRMPTVGEAKSLYERRKHNTDKDGDKIFIDHIFPKGAGWSTWTSGEKGRTAVVMSYKDEGWSGFEDKINGPDGFFRPVRSIKP